MKMQIASNHLLIIYPLFSISFFINWLIFQKRNPSLNPEEKFLSVIIILIITVFWSVALPLYCIKILRKNKI
jgi:hypothetical protein